MKNIYSTIFILLIFNSTIMGFLMYVNFELKKSDVTRWCEFYKENCQASYKIIHNINNNSSFIPTLEDIKPCLLNYDNYTKRADKILADKKKVSTKN